MKYQTIFAVAALAALTACGSKPQSDQNDVETPVSVQELRKVIEIGRASCRERV